MNAQYSPHENQFLKKVGSRIKHFREQKHLSQEYLALKANMDRTYIGGIERGERNISILNLKKIANALEKPISEFFKIED